MLGVLGSVLLGVWAPMAKDEIPIAIPREIPKRRSLSIWWVGTEGIVAHGLAAGVPPCCKALQIDLVGVKPLSGDWTCRPGSHVLFANASK